MIARTAFPVFAVALLASCASTYDPEWESGAPSLGGKADGLLDDLPVITVDGERLDGDVGGERLELYALALRRTDQVEVAMTVTSGDLNPHISLYLGTDLYIRSDTWSRDGDTLRKTYTADVGGRFMIAARAYRAEGSGEYSLRVRCVAGPCAGELPPPEDEFDPSDLDRCVLQTRLCAFEALPSYGGAVGEVRANSIVRRCLDMVALSDGTSCSTAYDQEPNFFEAIAELLPFYADQTEACVEEFAGCMDECRDLGQSWGSGHYDHLDSTCLSGDLNSTCDIYARRTLDCGGYVVDEGGLDCYERCLAVDGAFVDDTSDICGSGGYYCESQCDVDVAAMIESCGGTVTAESSECIIDLRNAQDNWVCEEAIDEALEGFI